MDFEFHPLANLFPLIEQQDLEELAADIKTNGLNDPIDIYQVKILDGRNRYRAAQAAGIELEPRHFRDFRPELHGDPLVYVISKNLKRRHLNDIQRASIAAKIANLGRGGDRSKPPIGGLPVEQAATTLNVAQRQVERARVVHQHGVSELREALDRGEIAVSAAESIARLPDENQPAALANVLPNGARAVMASRQEPADSLDFSPTPPWATRALIERVFPQLRMHADFAKQSVWEPACGEGHMAEVLREYAGNLFASDVHDYGYADTHDFLGDGPHGEADWIITNPPFGDKAEKFALRALNLAKVGVAIFARLQWLETIGRYERLFREQPPTLIAFFCERVNLCMGRWEPDGGTATAYIWLVWIKGRAPRAPFWIPPGCQEAFTRENDRERFTAHPIKAACHPQAQNTHREPAPDPIGGNVCDLSLPESLKRGADGLAPWQRVSGTPEAAR